MALALRLCHPQDLLNDHALQTNTFGLHLKQNGLLVHQGTEQTLKIELLCRAMSEDQQRVPRGRGHSRQATVIGEWRRAIAALSDRHRKRA